MATIAAGIADAATTMDGTGAAAIVTIGIGGEQRESPAQAGLFVSAAPLRAQPEAESDRHHSRQTKPGDGVLQMVVFETDVERSRLYA
jgi:hypothetical protein